MEACSRRQFPFVIRRMSRSNANACVFANYSVNLFCLLPVFTKTNNFDIRPIPIDIHCFICLASESNDIEMENEDHLLEEAKQPGWC